MSGKSDWNIISAPFKAVYGSVVGSAPQGVAEDEDRNLSKFYSKSDEELAADASARQEQESVSVKALSEGLRKEKNNSQGNYYVTPESEKRLNFENLAADSVEKQKRNLSEQGNEGLAEELMSLSQSQDPLFLAYPAFSQEIADLYGKGFSRTEIERSLNKQITELFTSGKYTYGDIQGLCGRSLASNMKLAEVVRNNISADVAKVRGEDVAAVKARATDAVMLGVPPEVFINNPDLHKSVVGDKGVKMTGNTDLFWKSLTAGVFSGEQSKVLWNFITAAASGTVSDSQRKQFKADAEAYLEFQKQSAAYMSTGFLNRVAQESGRLVGQNLSGMSEGVKKYGPWYALGAAGFAVSQATPLAPVSWGAAAGSVFGASASHGAFEQTARAESFEVFHALMQDKDFQTPQGERTAAQLAVAAGTINGYIEVGSLWRAFRILGASKLVPTALSRLTMKVGNEVFNLLPNTKNTLLKYGAEYVKELHGESLEEAEQALMSDLAIVLAKVLVKKDFSARDAFNALFSKEEAASLTESYTESLKSFGLGMLPGAVAGGVVRNAPGLALSAAQRLQVRSDVKARSQAASRIAENKAGAERSAGTEDVSFQKGEEAEQQSPKNEGADEGVVFVPKEILQGFAQDALTNESAQEDGAKSGFEMPVSQVGQSEGTETTETAPTAVQEDLSAQAEGETRQVSEQGVEGGTKEQLNKTKTAAKVTDAAVNDYLYKKLGISEENFVERTGEVGIDRNLYEGLMKENPVFADMTALHVR